MKHATSTQAACVRRGLLTTPSADVVSGHAGALTADRLLVAGVAHQPPGLAALGAASFGRQGAGVAGAADRPLRPVRRRPSRAAAVRAFLRSHRRARAAQHPPTSLPAARAHLPALLAPDGRPGPADRAQVRVAVDSEADDRAHPPAPTAGPDRPLVAALAPRSSSAGPADRQIAANFARLRRASPAVRALRLLARSRDRGRLATGRAPGVRSLAALRADPLLGPVAAVHAAHRAPLDRPNVGEAVARGAHRLTVLIARRPVLELAAARAHLRRPASLQAAVADLAAWHPSSQWLLLTAVKTARQRKLFDTRGDQLTDQSGERRRRV